MTKNFPKTYFYHLRYARKAMSKNNSSKTEHLENYYVEMKNNIDRPNESVHRLDNNGVLMYKIPYTWEFNYYPVSIALYALGNFEVYLDTKNLDCKEKFLKQADWLVNNIKIKPKGFGIWEHNFILPYYDFKIPWIHGMAQGLAISVLLRAYQLTSDKKYLNATEKAYKVFEVDIANGGVRFVDEECNAWIEEYAILPPPHVLNGFIFALFGIYDFYRVTKDEDALNLFKKEIVTLEKNIQGYDIGYWSLYNLLDKTPAAKSYHELHIKQLNVLYNLTKKEIFNEYATRWEKYYRSSQNVRRAAIKRGLNHIKKYGITGSVNRYLLVKKWRKK